jgi:phosphate-selective porin
MGDEVNGIHIVDTEFDSQFALLTRAFDRHRLSVRYDHFEVTQNDQTPVDDNPETGHSWTLGYQFGLSKKVSLAAEWLSIKTHRFANVYYGLPQTVTETQLQLLVKLRL